MPDSNLTDDELVRAVDNDPEATPRERELADRLNKQLNPPYKRLPARRYYDEGEV